MKLLLVGLIFLAFADTLYAQPKNFRWKGEREIIETKAENNEIKLLSSEHVTCGKYLIYSEYKDQQVVSFKFRVEKTDKNVSPYLHISLEILKIKLLDELDIPTVGYLERTKEIVGSKPNLRLSISKGDFNDADCLSELSVD